MAAGLMRSPPLLVCTSYGMKAFEGYANTYEDRLCRFVLSSITPQEEAELGSRRLRFIPLALTHRRGAIGPGTVGLDVHHLAGMLQRFIGKAVAQPVTHRTMQRSGPVRSAIATPDGRHVVL